MEAFKFRAAKKMIDSCRLCNSSKLSELIPLKNFPKSAQFFLNSKKDILLDNPIKLSVMQCLNCGLVQLLNDPVDYYKDVITAASLSEKSKLQLLKEWKDYLSRYDLKNKKAIEIGSCRGDFLDVLERLGFDAMGLENGSESVKIARDRGYKVIKGYIEECQEELKKKYSLVVCNNFLEHQPRTKQFLRCIRDLIEDDGLLYLSVPNLNYLLGKSCLYEFVADHLVYFTKSTLKTALEQNGFEVLEQAEKNNGNDLVVIARPIKKLDISHAQNVVEEIKSSLRRLIHFAKENNKTVSVWGAGHRALALMAISNIDYISFIVDSASFKQGKYSPILHKKIISPEEFLTQESDIIIIMLPGSYANQVIAYLDQNNSKSKVIVFNDEPLNEIRI